LAVYNEGHKTKYIECGRFVKKRSHFFCPNDKEVMKIDSFISWVGGKSALCNTIVQIMPEPCNRYIEVFGGAAWVLFAKPVSKELEVYNDYNSNLANLFMCVRDRVLSLSRELGFLPLNSRQEFDQLIRFIYREKPDDRYIQEEMSMAKTIFKEPELSEVTAALNKKADEYDVQRAAAFYKIIRHSYGSGCRSFDNRVVNIESLLSDISQHSERLKNVIIENMDFEALIRRYDHPESFFYCDPPYVFTEGHYAVEFPPEDHIRLRDVLAQSQGKFLVSYNDCPLVKELYKDFCIVEITRPNNLKQRYEGGSQFAEVFISNYDLNDKCNNQPKQMSMFQYQPGGELFDLDESNLFNDFRKKRENEPPIFITKNFRSWL